MEDNKYPIICYKCSLPTTNCQPRHVRVRLLPQAVTWSIFPFYTRSGYRSDLFSQSPLLNKRTLRLETGCRLANCYLKRISVALLEIIKAGTGTTVDPVYFSIRHRMAPLHPSDPICSRCASNRTALGVVKLLLRHQPAEQMPKLVNKCSGFHNLWGKI